MTDSERPLQNFVARTVQSLFTKVPMEPKLEQFTKFMATLQNWGSDELSEFNGFWTIDRMLQTSFAISGYYSDDGLMFNASHHGKATHKLYARSHKDPKHNTTRPTNRGLSTYIYQLMTANKPILMQFCVLRCEETGRYIGLDSIVRLLPRDHWQQFCLLKDWYSVYIR